MLLGLKTHHMKKILITVKIFLVVCCLQPLLLNAQNAKKTNTSSKAEAWKKTKDNSWPGVADEKTYWYKLDSKAKLMWSADRKSWEEDSDGMWADKEGVFYKLDGHKLVESTDAGNSWNETFEWKWLAVDGRWYKLDKDHVVWVVSK
jgi:hypothetical protein